MDDELMSAVPVPLVAEPTSIPSVPSTTTPDDADKKAKLGVDEKDESQLQAVVARRRLRAGRSAKTESSMLLPSFIWDFFYKDTTGKFVICTLCPDQTTRFAYSGGTSTMNRHLRKKHQKFAPGKCAADYEFQRATKRASSASSSGSVGGHSHSHGSHAGHNHPHGATSPGSLAHAHAAALQNAVNGQMAAGNNPQVAAAAVAAAAAAAAAAGSSVLSDSLAALGSVSPSELTRRHLIDLRNSRRRGLGATTSAAASLLNATPNSSGLNTTFMIPGATNAGSLSSSTSTGSKRRKIALLEGPESTSQLHAAAAAYNALSAASAGAGAGSGTGPGAVPVSSATSEFDPAGFVNLPSVMSAGGAGGLELGDAAAMDLGFVPGLDAYSLPPSMAHMGSASSSATAAALGYHHHQQQHRQRRSNQASQRLFTHRLLKYLIAQYEPLDTSHMGNELFVLLYGSEFPLLNSKLPNEDTLKSALANLYYSQREILKEVLAEVELLSLSLNNWKSVFGQNVLVVSGHWITHGFHRRDCVLEVYVVPLDESVNTVALLRDVMAKWDLPVHKIAALTMVKQPSTPTAHHHHTSVKSPSEPPSAGHGPMDHHAHHSGSAPQSEEEEAAAAVEAAAVAAAAAAAAAAAQVVHDDHDDHDDEDDDDVDDGEDHFAFFSSDESGETQEFGALSVINCFLHSLRNAMHAGLAKCASLVRRCHDYASYFIQNPSEYQLFLALQKKAIDESASAAATSASAGSSEPGATPLGVVLPVICDHDNQWNSVCAMICRIVQLEDMFALYKCNLEQDQAPLGPPPPSMAATTPTGTGGEEATTSTDVGATGVNSSSGSSSGGGGATATATTTTTATTTGTTTTGVNGGDLGDGSLGSTAEVVAAAPHHRRAMQLRFVCCDLTLDEKQNLKELARLLEPIETLVRVTTMEYPTLSLATPLVFALRKHLENAQLWITMPLVTAVRNAILSQLDLDLVGAVSKGCLDEQRQQQQLLLDAASNDPTASLAPLVASGCVGMASACSAGYLSCLLDPRFKSLAFLDAQEKDRMLTLLHLMHLELMEQKQQAAAAKLAAASATTSNAVMRKSSVGGTPSSSSMASSSASASASAQVASMSASSTTTLLNEFFPIDEPSIGATGAGATGGAGAMPTNGTTCALSSSNSTSTSSTTTTTSEMEEKLRLQVQEYLDSPLLAATEQSDADVFDWWNRYQRHFPLLSKLARKYLCICATSGSFVEEFSLVGGLQKEKKKRLDIEIVAQILFCQSACRIPEMERMNV